jgi:hypothetical protein
VAVGSGVYSLIGVFMGAGATGGFQLWLAARKDRRDTRAARRLVNAELTQIAFAIWGVSEHPEWGGSDEMQRRMTAHSSWDAYAEVLARELSKEKWSTLPIAYEGAEALAGIVAIAPHDKAAQQQNEPVIERVRLHIRSALEATKDEQIQLPIVEMGLGVGGISASIGSSRQPSRTHDDSTQ